MECSDHPTTGQNFQINIKIIELFFFILIDKLGLIDVFMKMNILPSIFFSFNCLNQFIVYEVGLKYLSENLIKKAHDVKKIKSNYSN